MSRPPYEVALVIFQRRLGEEQALATRHDPRYLSRNTLIISPCRRASCPSCVACSNDRYGKCSLRLSLRLHRRLRLHSIAASILFGRTPDADRRINGPHPAIFLPLQELSGRLVVI